MAEIWSKSFLTIGENDYEIGDIIFLLKYKENGIEKEISEAIISDIALNSIVVNENFGKNTKDIVIAVEDIIEK